MANDALIHLLERACAANLDSKGLRLRREADEDMPYLRDIYRQLRMAEFAFLPLDETQKAALIDGQFDIQRHQYAANYPASAWMVLEGVDRVPAGRYYVAEDEAGLRVVDIALRADRRGQGVGTALLRAAQQVAGDRGCGVSLHVDKTNPAQSLYLRLGFRITGDTGVSLRMDWPERCP